MELEYKQPIMCVFKLSFIHLYEVILLAKKIYITDIINVTRLVTQVIKEIKDQMYVSIIIISNVFSRCCCYNRK